MPATAPVPLAARIERWADEGAVGFQVSRLCRELGLAVDAPPDTTRTEALIHLGRLLAHPPDEAMLTWDFLHGIECLWFDGGNADGVDEAAVSAALGMPVFRGSGGMFAGEAGGLAILRENGCRGMVCDLGQSVLKISWTGRRWTFARDLAALPLSAGTESIAEKGAQRRALRGFAGRSLAAALAEAAAGRPEGVVFAVPSELDRWGQPSGSSYIGMTMDTQLVPDALELAGLPDTHLWLLNDAELAAVSALQDSRVLDHPGALVFTLGTAAGTAIANPVPYVLRLLAALE